MESILSKTRYVAGNQLTEADVRLFMTLIRFDEVGQGVWLFLDEALFDWISHARWASRDAVVVVLVF